MQTHFYRNLVELYLRGACTMCETNFWSNTDKHKRRISHLINHINKKQEEHKKIPQRLKLNLL